MKQYLELLKTIQEKGTYKPAAREGMPGTQSLFGYQFRHDLSEGFPLLTTKKVFWKGVVTELLWFLRGDTNIKYLVDNGVNIWNEDAYNYYLKLGKEGRLLGEGEVKSRDETEFRRFTFEEFVDVIKNSNQVFHVDGYKLGDCGYQYGRVWRDWEHSYWNNEDTELEKIKVDQIARVIKSLKESPEGRRHIVSAIDPAHDNDLALYWCHALFQFNCRPLSTYQRVQVAKGMGVSNPQTFIEETNRIFDEADVPKYYLDCQLYQRSADVVLGVPFNIASYALLIHIIAKICNMVPGEFIHTFGDVHIYDNHREAVEEQLGREPGRLPTLKLEESINWENLAGDMFLQFHFLKPSDFILEGYNPQPAIKAELSTGLKK